MRRAGTNGAAAELARTRSRSLLARSLFGALMLLAASPASAADLADTLAARGGFSKLLEAVKAAGLEPLLHRKGPYTVFAPTDAAFVALPAALMRPENKQELAKVLSYHLVVGRVGSSDWRARKVSVKSAAGLPLTIEDKQGRLTVDSVSLTQADLTSDNGVVHVIDQLLTPPQPIAPKT